jgi:exodeoxyribonuclease VII large subunit
VDPTAVLARGYSITSDAQGHVVRRAASLSPGARITTRLAEGSVESEVKKI